MFLDILLKHLFTFVGRCLKAWRRQRLVVRAQHWAQVPGSALEGHADCLNDSSYAICSAEINYTHRVDGELFAGSVSLPADDKRHAEGLALGWRNREILVRYSPDDPTTSTLLLEEQHQPLPSIPNE